MRKIALTIAAAMTMFAAGSLLPDRAGATIPGAAMGLRQAAQAADLSQEIRYRRRHYRYYGYRPYYSYGYGYYPYYRRHHYYRPYGYYYRPYGYGHYYGFGYGHGYRY